MGWETANIHLADRKRADKVKQALKRHRADWLHAAAKEMLDAITEDWNDWREQAKGAQENPGIVTLNS